MLQQILKAIVGSQSDRDLRRLRAAVAQIQSLEAQWRERPEAALREQTSAWKAELSVLEDHAILASRLGEILPEAFAVLKNACRRMAEARVVVPVRGHEVIWDMVPFDEQLMGGMAMHEGKVAEMATGEGKTLVAILPAYLHALTGRGVHVVTVNDYLAARDSEWMGAVYRTLGLTVGCLQHDQSPEERRAQYAADITYGTNSEFGFDYLRDQGMARSAAEQVQRGHYFALVDEVDSILIDEARTPLIISGPAVVATEGKVYDQFKPAIIGLVQSQERLCRRFLKEAAALGEALQPRDGSEPSRRAELERQLGLLLYRVKLGAPRMPELHQMLERGENRRWMSRAEMSLHGDQSKTQLYAEKEQLFYAIDEKGRDADLTEKGRQLLSPTDPEAFVVPDIATQLHGIDQQKDLGEVQRREARESVQRVFSARTERIHVIAQLLKAYSLYERDVHYVVQENKVIIVDEHTGRALPGRRWHDGLHQAVEAKEGVAIERETQTYATITIQNYFRLYRRLAGMTGTAETEAQELHDIYGLGVLAVPTHKPCARRDLTDTVYKTKREKWDAVVREIQEVHRSGRPVLVGTVSVEASEHLSRLLSRTGVAHSVLNAKQPQQEAEIVARAGARGAVTLATNMAGRGTDIKLGPGVAELGGLHVVGTERHESRRIDRQLRGRCARQGDPGSSHFFLSLEDDLMRLFASERLVRHLGGVGLREGQELQHPLLAKAIEQAQKRVEQHHFQARRRTLEFDDVMNRHRDVVYTLRQEILHAAEVRERLLDTVEEVVVEKVRGHLMAADETSADYAGLTEWVNRVFPLGISAEDLRRRAEAGTEEPESQSRFDGLSAPAFAVALQICRAMRDAYAVKAESEQADSLLRVERWVMLAAVDRPWQEHLGQMDSLRLSISLRAYGQKDPLVEYKAEAYRLFEELMQEMKGEMCQRAFTSASSLAAFQEFLRRLPGRASHATPSPFATESPSAEPSSSRVARSGVETSASADTPVPARPVRSGPKVGRNEPCACGSGRKHKQCCGS